jgi:methionyl-tRNA formyltransferase
MGPVQKNQSTSGQGWSPITWQILEGACCIPISLFEAVADLDAGPIHMQISINLNAAKLVDE